MAAKRHDKQHAPRAASLKRIAKGYRGLAQLYKDDPSLKRVFIEAARLHEKEAKLLGTLR